MRITLKKLALAFGVIAVVSLIIVVAPKVMHAVYNDDTSSGLTNLRVGNIKITDTGLYDSSAAIRLQLGSDNHFTGNTSLSGGQESMGTLSVALSTQNTSGLSAGPLYYAYLAGTVNALEGSALVSTTSASGNLVSVIVAPATALQTNFVGVASAAVSTGSVVGVYSAGAWAQALTTGTVVAGDALATASTSGGSLFAPFSGSVAVTTNAVCAVALTAGNSAGGRIRVRLK